MFKIIHREAKKMEISGIWLHCFSTKKATQDAALVGSICTIRLEDPVSFDCVCLQKGNMYTRKYTLQKSSHLFVLSCFLCYYAALLEVVFYYFIKAD